MPLVLVVMAYANSSVGYEVLAPAPSELYGALISIKFSSGGQGGGNTFDQLQQKISFSDTMNTETKEIFKHLYIHAAPEEKQRIHPQKKITVPPAQKYVNFIFIKYPTQIG